VTRPARSPADVTGQAARAADLAGLDRAIVGCRACPRLVTWREQVARERRAAYRDEEYWGRAVPGFGDPAASVLVIGLAPGAHGANRTGRVFTGDRSGDWLYASMHRVGLASQPTSTSRDDGLRLTGARVVAAVRCAPPDNRPTPAERDCCSPWLDRELALLTPTVRVVVALGGFAWQAAWAALGRAGAQVPRPRPAFAHGAQARSGELTVLGCYHPSQQNTFTGRLTERMLDDVLGRAAHLAGLA
jgi:uracil-DNA glycosylase family 4